MDDDTLYRQFVRDASDESIYFQHVVYFHSSGGTTCKLSIYTEGGLVQRVALDSNTNEPIRVIVVEDDEPQKLIWAFHEALDEAVAKLAVDCSRREALSIVCDEAGARMVRAARTHHSTAEESFADAIAFLREVEALLVRAMAVSQTEPPDFPVGQPDAA